MIFPVIPLKDKIYRVFVDPTGVHSIISCTSGCNYYIPSRASKPIPLAKWKGLVLESIAWNKYNQSDVTTTRILMGSDCGSIHEAVIEAEKEKSFKKIFDLSGDDQASDKVPICGLEYEIFPSSDGGKEASRMLVMVATPTRHYQFIGGPTFEALFQLYAGRTLPKFIELPGTLSYRCVTIIWLMCRMCRVCAVFCVFVCVFDTPACLL